MDSIQSILDNILLDITEINKNIVVSNSLNDINILYNKLKVYDDDLQKINKTVKIISSLKDNLKMVFNNHILKKSNKVKKTSILKKNKHETSPDKSQFISYKNLTNTDKFKDLDCVKFPVINISYKELDSVINTPIYFITETNEYCLKVNNNLIKGNIGNIIDNNEDKDKTHYCKRTNCNGFHFNKKCKFLHLNEVKNFPNYSWKYINKNKMGKSCINKNRLMVNIDNENTRHIGSLDSLNEDLVLSSNDEKKLRNSQLMHDILLYQILTKYLS